MSSALDRIPSSESESDNSRAKVTTTIESDEEVEEKFHPPTERPVFERTERTETKYDLRIHIKKPRADPN
jgi:hypothetical protein